MQAFTAVIKQSVRIFAAATSLALAACGGGSGGSTAGGASEFPSTVTLKVNADHSLSLDWPLAPKAVAYNLYCSDTSPVDLATAKKNIDVSPPFRLDVIPASTVNCVVTAIDGFARAETAPSPAVRVTFPPAAPSDVQALAIPGELELSWSEVPNAQSYRVYVFDNADTAFAHALKSAPTVATTLTLKDLTPGKVYRFVVTSLSTDGDITRESVGSSITNQTPKVAIEPLAVNATSPAPSVVNVDASALNFISVTFNRPLDPSSVSSQTIIVSGPTGAVGGDVTIGSGGSILKFAPAASFKSDTAYHVTVRGGIKDVVGLRLASDYDFTFTTVRVDAQGAPEFPPKVLALFPSRDQADIDPSLSTIDVSFDKPMAAASISPNTLTLLTPEGDKVAGAVSYDQAGKTAHFAPLRPLRENIQYTISISPDVQDTAGLRLGTALVANFRTASAKLELKDAFGAPENSTTVGVVTVNNVENRLLTYRITAGADQALFSISTAGVLSFRIAPNFEKPGDANRDNRYELVIAVSDGTNSSGKPVSVAVSDADDLPPQPKDFAVTHRTGRSGEMHLSWMTVPNVSYRVYRRVEQGVSVVNEFKPIAIDLTKGDYIDSGLVSGTPYTYFVESRNAFETNQSGQVVGTASMLTSDVVTPDAKMRSCIDRYRLTYVSDFSTIDCPRSGIVSLGGLDKFFAVVSLNFQENAIADIGPVRQFLINNKVLKILFLENNPILDYQSLFAAIGAHPALTELQIGDRGLLSLAIAADELKNSVSLDYLGIFNSAISNFSPIGSIVRLKKVKIVGNLTTIDLPGLAGSLAAVTGLTSLTLSGANGNLTGVGKLVSLRDLTIADSGISSVAELASLVNLRTLNLANNKITDVIPLLNISNLTELNVAGNLIATMPPAGGWPALGTLDLQSNRLTDATALASLTTLKKLLLTNNSLTHGIPSLARLALVGQVDLVANVDIPCDHLDALSTALGKGVVIRPAKCSAKIIDVIISDSELASCVHGAKDVYASWLTSLKCPNKLIHSLSGVQNFVGLVELDLGGTAAADISALQGLSKLAVLNLANTKIDDQDVSLLSGFGALTSVNVSGNQITSLAPLSGLPRLSELIATDNKIAGLGGTGSFSNLLTLDVSGNPNFSISSLSSVPNVTRIRLARTGLTDSGFHTIARKGDLRELDVSGNKLTALDPQDFQNLPVLESLDVSNNPIDSFYGLRWASSLRSINASGIPYSKFFGLGDQWPFLKNIEEIYLNNTGFNQFADIIQYSGLRSLGIAGNRLLSLSDVGSFPLLTSLNAASNGFSDVSVVTHLINLETLDLGNNSISSINGFQNLSRLTKLVLRNNRVSDLGPIAADLLLRELDVSGNAIANFLPLASLNLLMLDISNTGASDLSKIASNANLVVLNAERNAITSLDSLRALASLERLDVSNNRIDRIGSVSNWKSLTWLDLSYNSISDVSPLPLLGEMRTLRIYHNNISFNESGEWAPSGGWSYSVGDNPRFYLEVLERGAVHVSLTAMNTFNLASPNGEPVLPVLFVLGSNGSLLNGPPFASGLSTSDDLTLDPGVYIVVPGLEYTDATGSFALQASGSGVNRFSSIPISASDFAVSANSTVNAGRLKPRVGSPVASSHVGAASAPTSSEGSRVGSRGGSLDYFMLSLAVVLTLQRKGRFLRRGSFAWNQRRHTR